MQDWTIEIKPRKKWLDVDIKGIWRYRDLLYMYVKRDIVTVYKQTILGPLWFLIQPIFTTVMYMFVFGGLAGISTDGAPQPLFYLSGIMLWNYFSEAFKVSSNVFVTNANVFGKVYFPRLVVPISKVFSNLLRFAIQLGLFAVIYLFFYFGEAAIHPNWYVLLTPLFVVILAGLGLGFGILVSSMTTKYRDMSILFTFIVQLWMYGTPIVYPLSMVPEGTLRTFILLNPMTPVVEAFKFATLGQGYFSWWALAYSFAFMSLLLVLGVVVFNKVQRSFMDTV